MSRFKCFVVIPILLLTLDLFADEPLELICTGRNVEDLLGDQDTFYVSIDLEEKSIVYEQNGVFNTESYWNEELCPKPTWTNIISESKFIVISKCSESSDDTFVRLEIDRANAKYIESSYRSWTFKGDCKRVSERKF